MKKSILVGGIVVVVVLAAWGFWRLGGASPMPTDAATLTVEQAPVELRLHNESDWKEVTDTVAAHEGDAIRTGPGGSASITFFDRAQTRLNQKTELVLSRANQTPGVPLDSHVELTLVSGRIWSRIIRLLDLDASFAARTSDAVATVRGTAFDLERATSGTTIWVSDSAVEMGGKMMVDGHKGHMRPKTQQMGSMDEMTKADFATPWSVMNARADERFMSSIRESIIARYGQGVSSSSWRSTLAGWSRSLHLAFAGARATEMRAAYLGEQLYDIRQFIQAGKSGFAFQKFSSLEQSMSDELQDLTPEQVRMTRAAYQRVTAEFMMALDDHDPASSEYRMKQRLEDLNVVLSGPDEMRVTYARLVATGNRLDEAADARVARRFEDSQRALDAAAQGIASASHDLEQFSARGMRGMSVETLQKTYEAMKAREAFLREQVIRDRVLAESEANATSTPTLPEQATSTWSRIELSALPVSIHVGESSTLTVTGIATDGSKTNLTTRSTFSMSGATGTMRGDTFLASQAGTAIIQATFQEGDAIFHAEQSIKIQEPVRISRLEIVAQGSTTVAPGGQVPVSVKAVYTNAHSVLLAPSKVMWATSDPNQGSVKDGVFTAWMNGSGPVTITASYVEDGKTYAASLVFQVLI